MFHSAGRNFRIEMNFTVCVLISILIHMIFFWNWDRSSVQDIPVKVNRGISISLQSISLKAAGTKGDASLSKISGDPGAVSKEIERFKNSLIYPEDAIAQELEADCIWKLILEEGTVKEIISIHKCRYEIFDSHFRKSAKDWKFQLAGKQELTVPVSFKIKGTANEQQ